MPKIKTHKGTSKRVKTTSGGKLKRRQSFQGHKLEKKSQARKRSLGRMVDVAPSNKKRVRRLLNV